MNREYGWSPRGEPAVITGKKRGRRLNIVGAMAMDGPRGAMTYTGSMNTERMVEFVENHLGPNLRKGDIVVMDGLRVHRTDDVQHAIASYGATAIILPPYSPELNPIEHLWSTLKARIRAVGVETWSRLKELVSTTWDGLDDHFFENWVRHCGYAPST